MQKTLTVDYQHEPREAYSLAELARRYGVSSAFLRLEVARKHLPCVRLGRRVLVRRQDWDAYVAARRDA